MTRHLGSDAGARCICKLVMRRTFAMCLTSLLSSVTRLLRDVQPQTGNRFITAALIFVTALASISIVGKSHVIVSGLHAVYTLFECMLLNRFTTCKFSTIGLIYTVSQTILFVCQNFVKFSLILINFGR